MEPTKSAELVLPVVLDLGGAPAFLARLEPALLGSSIAIDGSMLQVVDTPGIQLLCALVRAAEQRGIPLTWVSVSPMLVSFAKVIGVDHVLGLDGVRQEGLEWFE